MNAITSYTANVAEIKGTTCTLNIVDYQRTFSRTFKLSLSNVIGDNVCPCCVKDVVEADGIEFLAYDLIHIAASDAISSRSNRPDSYRVSVYGDMDALKKAVAVALFAYLDERGADSTWLSNSLPLTSVH